MIMEWTLTRRIEMKTQKDKSEDSQDTKVLLLNLLELKIYY